MKMQAPYEAGLKLTAAIPIFSIAMAAAAWGLGPAPPGTLNAISGEVSINGVSANPASGFPQTLQEDGVIRTGQGMAEILLSPGSILRLGRASELKLETVGTPGITARLRRGEALLEVLAANGALSIEQSGVTATVRNPGLYEFNEKRSVIAVYAGEARLDKDGQQLVANSGFGVRTRRFRVFPASSDSGNALFSWSRSRSEQLSIESRASAQENSGARPGTPHWQWDSWSASYTFLSASGFVTGPFGWPYFSPGYAPDSIPVRHGDSWLYGPPVLSSPGVPGGLGTVRPIQPELGNTRPTVPLTTPGEPRFPSNR